ncbi:HK97 family phage prohead protease [Flavobacterium aestivum]|uniref:HK97 family phage prohead protease n=1 Tax=Flavobacterium aestivum TaxID=3003257 RepID=UPI002483184A|nr:HK97 family phage prohead protease [Flavobacterium aestivum]
MMESKDYIQKISETAERRFFSSEVRTIKKEERTDENSAAIIEGYAAKFNSDTVIGYYYQFREKIRKGAFDDVLKDDVRCLFNHNPNYVLARCFEGKGTLTLSVDKVGLKYSYETPDRQYARDLQNAIELGDISQSSFAFDIEEEIWTEVDGEMAVREIVKFKRLYDVSPVTYPAYADTEVAKRSLDAFKEKVKPNPVQEETRADNNKELNAFDAQIIINSNLD